MSIICGIQCPPLKIGSCHSMKAALGRRVCDATTSRTLSNPASSVVTNSSALATATDPMASPATRMVFMTSQRSSGSSETILGPGLAASGAITLQAASPSLLGTCVGCPPMILAQVSRTTG
eukprot:scaffold904_cov239-Pinguiococcus_pyrenoidosus.AAC.4